ncbi:MAG: aquaporin, partial [Bryobacteraceae bacterium]
SGVTPVSDMPRRFAVTVLGPSASFAEALKAHWREYLMESAQIGALMFCICLSATLLYGSESPLRALAIRTSVKPFIMGTAVALSTFLIIRSRFGRRTGAHLNPSLTLTYFFLGRIHRWDALNYVAFQFVGALAGVWTAHGVLGDDLSMPPVCYAITVPGTYGSAIALLSEFLLSALVMGVVLFASNRKYLVSFSPVLGALITIFYYGFCPSLSGFSVNPARSFSSALFAFVWRGFWIYLAAPTLGMVAAASLYTGFGSWGAFTARRCFMTWNRRAPLSVTLKNSISD